MNQKWLVNVGVGILFICVFLGAGLFIKFFYIDKVQILPIKPDYYTLNTDFGNGDTVVSITNIVISKELNNEKNLYDLFKSRDFIITGSEEKNDKLMIKPNGTLGNGFAYLHIYATVINKNDNGTTFIINPYLSTVSDQGSDKLSRTLTPDKSISYNENGIELKGEKGLKSIEFAFIIKESDLMKYKKNINLSFVFRSDNKSKNKGEMKIKLPLQDI